MDELPPEPTYVRCGRAGSAALCRLRPDQQRAVAAETVLVTAAAAAAAAETALVAAAATLLVADAVTVASVAAAGVQGHGVRDEG